MTPLAEKNETNKLIIGSRFSIPLFLHMDLTYFSLAANILFQEIYADIMVWKDKNLYHSFSSQTLIWFAEYFVNFSRIKYQFKLYDIYIYIYISTVWYISKLVILVWVTDGIIVGQSAEISFEIFSWVTYATTSHI